ncbi:MAG: hypothetical protein P4L84_07985 [Isosphaeraceae bacterium]|nr:hypothetical protein [Isosphaeraceae bacterium]
MEHHDEPLRDRLIDKQWPPSEKLAGYREEVDVLLEQLRRRKWWADVVRAVLTTLGAVVLFPLAVLFGLMLVYLLVGGSTLASAWFPATAGFLCLAGAVALVRWFFRQRADDLLLEVKRLQAQGLEFEEQMRRRDGR